MSVIADFMNDPNWADFIPDVNQSGPKCRLPAHGDCSPLDVEKVAGHLEKGGTLGSMKGYETRPGQLDMLRAITRAYNDQVHLMVEAGTGVGKSLAYLVPSVQWSFINDTPVVISTATRNLQSQLTGADLPRAAQTLGGDAAKFRWSVLKGRVNYLCLRALEEYMQGGWWTLNAQEQEEFSRFHAWLLKTTDGDLDDFGGEELRSRLCCPSEDCWGRACRFANKCFIAKARARALRSHIVVANHSLVLAEAANPGSGLLPAYGRIVFDEAHNLEDIATDYFSYELSPAALSRLLGRLSRPGRSRRGRGVGMKRGLLGTIERQLAKGAVKSAEDAESIRELVTRAYVQSEFAARAGDALFEVLKGLFAPSPKADVIRYRSVPAGVDGGEAGNENAPVRRQYALKGIFADYTTVHWDEAALTAAMLNFENALAKLQGLADDLGNALEKAADDEDSSPVLGDIAVQAYGMVRELTAFILESKCVLGGTDADRVFWAEKMEEASVGRRKRASSYLRLVAAPLSVAEEMKRCFYDVKDTVVMCSATLRAGDRFDYMARKLGLDLVAAEPPAEVGEDAPGGPRVRALVASSPFDYFRQALVLALDSLPEPGDAEYPEKLAPLLCDLFFQMRGRSLALFTSYDLMRRTADLARERFVAAGLKLLVQGEGFSREQMVDRLRVEPSTVLFGAQSFWEGVDVPGEALSCVVLTRLPFPQVGEPITEARCEKIVESGGSEFRDFMLPEALIRFRQGFGRLVRSKKDRGVVLITDQRIVRKNYGAVFRKAIAASVHTVTSPAEVLDRTTDFFS